MRASRIAEILSAATRLPLLAVPLFFVVGFYAAGWEGVAWAVVCVLLTSGLSLAYLRHLVRTGKVKDPGRILKAERVRPLWVVAGFHAGAWALVSALGGPAELRAVLLSYALSTVAFALITPLAKLSLHAAGAAGVLVCLVRVFGPVGGVFIPLFLAICWSRAALGRHTAAELALGTLVGGIGTWVAFAHMVA
ncbi:MAG: hypothetical protein IRY88_10655 [Rubrobacteraceae bacterium]|uniref:hypothetical protein n=1 Tax=Rubrobacter naiadicus TaxID=1392641 RepID=UPI00235F918E|nr:hypothetical protein [Rubrobacter naiadicus]MBX6764124.1 hypothetical protein [Rubrobacteraceae bacterium]